MYGVGCAQWVLFIWAGAKRMRYQLLCIHAFHFFRICPFLLEYGDARFRAAGKRQRNGETDFAHVFLCVLLPVTLDVGCLVDVLDKIVISSACARFNATLFLFSIQVNMRNLYTCNVPCSKFLSTVLFLAIFAVCLYSPPLSSALGTNMRVHPIQTIWRKKTKISDKRAECLDTSS